MNREVPLSGSARAAAAAEPVAGPEPWSLYRARTPVHVSLPFHDDGANDTHTCTIGWDDGSARETVTAANGVCARDHVFAHAGMYTITSGLTDDDSGTDHTATIWLPAVRAPVPAGALAGVGRSDPGRHDHVRQGAER